MSTVDVPVFNNTFVRGEPLGLWNLA